MNWHDRITVDPDIIVGKPLIKGTRLAVEFVTELLANGWTEQQIIANYPGLVADDIRACLSYAHDLIQQERVFKIAN